MEQNIVMQITHECNPNEARFRAGDFLIGTETALNKVKNHKVFPSIYIFPNKYYTIEKSTIEDVKNSKNVKYHYISHKTPDAIIFTIETISKEAALEKLSNKKRIAIKFDDDRLLKEVLSEDEQLNFLKEVAQYESECVLNEDWTNWTSILHKQPQINYYKNLKSDDERQIYADAIGQQYALNLLLGPISVLTDSYDLDCINTFFKNTEFYFDDSINQDKTQDDNEYLTSLRIKELWLPADHFNLDDNIETKTINCIECIQIDDAVEQYSFTNNRIRYDSHWYGDFLIKL